MTNLNGLKICFIGVGNCGVNSIQRLKHKYEDVDFIMIDTDSTNFSLPNLNKKLLLTVNDVAINGCGGDNVLANEICKQNRDNILNTVRGYDIAIIYGGLGGGTATSAVSYIANVCRSIGSLTISVVTKPFSFEGEHKKNIALIGLNNTLNSSDIVVNISNDKILFNNGNLTLEEAYKVSDEMIDKTFEVISNLLQDGFIKIDYADLKKQIRENGLAYLNIATATGKNKINEVLEELLNNTLLDYSIQKSQTILFSIIASKDVSLNDIDKISKILELHSTRLHNLLYSYRVDEEYQDKITISLIATNYDEEFDENILSRVSVNSTLEQIEEQLNTEANDIIPQFLKNLKKE